MKDFEPAFWVVWAENGGSPTCKHESFDTAKAEAKRLARLHGGQRFIVMAAALAYVKDDLREVEFDDPDGPF